MNRLIAGIVLFFISSSALGQSVLNPDEVRIRKHFVLSFDTTIKKYQWELKGQRDQDTGLYLRVRTGSGVNYWQVGHKPESWVVRSSTGLTLTRKKMADIDSLIIDGTPVSSVAWGSVIGTLSNQTDLQSALNAKQGTISLTTNGSSGAATLIGNTLNIPQYGGGGGTWGSITGNLADQIDLNSALNGKQGADADLTQISSIASVNDDIIQKKAGVWTNRSPSQVKTDLALTKTDVGLANVDNTSDLNKPVSTATQTALNLKANLASPTFTGTVSGITKSMVGLANVDNTSDLSKPVSTATQAALNGKANTTHGHAIADVTNLQTELDKAIVLGNATGTGSDLFRWVNDSTYKLRRVRFGSGFDTATSTGDEIIVSSTGGVAWGGITGTLSNQTDLQTALNGKQATLVSATNIKTVNGNSLLGSGDINLSSSVAWGNVTGTLSAQTDLQTALNGKANTSHTHAQADVTNLVSDLANKQPLLSSNSSNLNFNAVTVENASAAVNAQTGTTYTLVAGDNGKIITLNNAAAITLTVPSTLPTGFNCTIIQLGAGQVTVTASGVTIQNRQSHTKLAGQYAMATLVEYSANVLAFQGDTTN